MGSPLELRVGVRVVVDLFEMGGRRCWETPGILDAPAHDGAEAQVGVHGAAPIGLPSSSP